MNKKLVIFTILSSRKPNNIKIKINIAVAEKQDHLSELKAVNTSSLFIRKFMQLDVSEKQHQGC